MQVKLKAVSDGVVVDASREAAGPHQRVAVETKLVGERAQLFRRAARVTAAASANVNPQFVSARVQATFQCAQN